MRRHEGTIAALFWGYCVYNFARKSLSVAGPAFIAELSLTRTEFGSIASSFSLAYGASKLLGGIICDRAAASCHVVFCIGLLLSTLCNLAFGVCNSLPLFCAVWAVHGLVQGLGWPSASKLVYDNTEESGRGLAWALIAAAGNLGHSVAPILLLRTATRSGWRSVFYWTAATTALTSVFSFIGLAPRGAPGAGASCGSGTAGNKNGGATAVVTGANGAAKGASNGNASANGGCVSSKSKVIREWGWEDDDAGRGIPASGSAFSPARPRVISQPSAAAATQATAAAAAAPAAACQQSKEQPAGDTPPWEWLRNSPRFWLHAVADLGIYFCLKSLSDWTPLYLIETCGHSPAAAVQLYFWCEAGAIAGSLAAGALSDRVGWRNATSCAFGLALLPSLAAFWATVTAAASRSDGGGAGGGFVSGDSYVGGGGIRGYFSAWSAASALFAVGFCVNGPKTLGSIALVESLGPSSSGLAASLLALVGQFGALAAGAPVGFLAETRGWAAVAAALAAVAASVAAALVGLVACDATARRKEVVVVRSQKKVE